jgi:hypothetical protein
MANITVSTSSNFDDAGNLALLNGENITINSDAVLTVNSDNRWGQNAAVPNVITVTQGELYIDATETWWIPFDASTGNVPALGTRGTPDVTRSGSPVGEFLGVFTALGVAPSAAGGAMPTTGFVKLRTKSTTLADNDVLTFTGGATITINSTTGGQRGWLHFVGAEGTTSTTGYVTIPRLGKVTTRGDWFVLGTSNGTAGQVFQHYVADFVSALQVETGNGTGIYEWWGYAVSGDFTTVVGTDERGRYFTSTSAGVITFGGGANGKLPPNGARIRVPNIHVSSSTSANWTANTFNTATQTNRFEFNSTGGIIDMRNVSMNGVVLSRNAPDFIVTDSAGADSAWNGGTATTAQISNLAALTFTNVAASRVFAGNFVHFSSTYNFNVQYINCASFQTSGSGTGTGALGVTNSTGVTITNFVMINGKSIDPFNVNFCNGVTISGTIAGATTTNNILAFSGCTDVSITSSQISPRSYEAAGTTANYGAIFTNCVGVLVDTVSVWQGTRVPVFGLISAASQTKDVRIRNIGTRASPMDFSTGRYAIYLANVSDVFISRVYASGGSQANDSIVNNTASDNVVISDCGDPTATTSLSISSNVPTNTTWFKRNASGGSKIFQTAILNGRTPNNFTAFGFHFIEEETSSTEVQLAINCGTEKSSYAKSIAAYTDDVGTILRDGTNGLLLRTLNDQVTWTWNYWIRGLSGFANVAPIISGTNTGNFTITYDLDKGTGFSGTFKALTAGNLSGETGVSPTGVKARVRAVCNTANASNLLRTIAFYGVTSNGNITANPYPYNEPPVIVSGIVSGSLGAVFRNSDGKRLDTVSGTTGITMYPEWFSDTTTTLRIRKPGYDAIISEFTLTESGLAYPVSQVDNTIGNTDPGALGITVTNHGASPVTWETKQWSITITVTDSSTTAQIAQWISWHTAQDSFSLGGGFHNMAWPSMIIPSGTSFETVRGTLFGSAGATLKGVRIVDGSGNAIGGFARMQADDGTYYQPPQVATFALTNLKPNTEVRVYKTSDMSDIAGEEDIDDGSFEYNYTWSVDIPITVSVVSLAYQDIQFQTTLTAAGTSIPISQQIDRQYFNPV